MLSSTLINTHKGGVIDMGRPMIRDFKIDDIIDDMQIVSFVRDELNHDLRAVCRCTKCNRVKTIRFFCLHNKRGTKHSSCGQYVKTIDKRFHRIWCSLKTRIHNKNYHHYHRYGGRGLDCDYDNFIDFYDDMYDSYLEALDSIGRDVSIDRIDNNLGYVKNNLRWVSQKTQVRNSSKVKVFYCFSPYGDVYISNNQTMFADKHNLSSKQINACLNGRYQSTNGWVFVYQHEIMSCPVGVIEEMYY